MVGSVPEEVALIEPEVESGVERLGLGLGRMQERERAK